MRLTATISNIETLRHWWSRNAPSLFVSEFQWLDHGWTWRPRLLLAFLQIGTMGRRHSPPIGNGHDRSCMNHDETKTGFVIMICNSANNIIHLSMINWSWWGWWEVSYIGWGNCHFDDHGHGELVTVLRIALDFDLVRNAERGNLVRWSVGALWLVGQKTMLRIIKLWRLRIIESFKDGGSGLDTARLSAAINPALSMLPPSAQVLYCTVLHHGNSKRGGWHHETMQSW